MLKSKMEFYHWVWRFTCFYRSFYAQNKDESRELLKKLRHSQELPWLVYGDFNEILYSFEKEKGLPRDERRMEAFRNTLVDCYLMDVGYLEGWFTWERGNLLDLHSRKTNPWCS